MAMTRTVSHITITNRHIDESIGICIECGAEQYGCEPDARNYVCESCFIPAVFGSEELLQMGAIYDDTELFDQE